MGSIDDREDARLAGAPADFLHRHPQGSRRGDMTQVDDLGTLRYATPEVLHDLRLALNWQWNGLVNVSRPRLFREKLPGVIAGAVLMIAGQDFITRTQVQGAGNNVHAVRRIGNEYEIIGIPIQVYAERLACFADQ